MSDREPSQSFREFMYQDVCEHLTPKEVKSLAYSQGLPAPYLSKDATEILMKLESEVKFSENNLEPLAKMMRAINRKDIAKKVEKFVKKKQKQSSKKEAQSNSVSMLQDCSIVATLKTTQLCTKMLLEQAEELRSTAGERGYTSIEREMADALALLERDFQHRLRLVASHLHCPYHLRQDSMESQCSSPPCSLMSDDFRSPGSTLERGYRARADAMSKSASLPKDFSSSPKKPILPPPRPTDQEDEHTYEYVEHSPPRAKHVPNLYYSSSDIAPQNREDESRGQMVTGRDGAAKPKPAVAPKPKKSSTQVLPVGGENDYTGGTTSTGDSGFVDAQQFMKETAPRVKPRHKYTALNAEQREEAPSYALPSTGIDKDVVYDQVCHESLYMNVEDRL